MAEAQVTPEVDPVSPDGGESNSDPAGNQPEEPFLSVNDRTVYKTREDAVKAYDEAGRRIAQLSSWEKQAKEVGITDPKVIRELVNETLELRKFKADLEKDGAKNGKPQPTTTDSNATPEEKKAIEWLKEANMKLGYIPREEVMATVEELKAEIASLKESGTQSEAQAFKNQEAECTKEMADWVKGDFGDDPQGKKVSVMGTLIKNWINSDQELIARWSQRGMEARNLVREGYELFKGDLGWAKPTPAATPGAQSTAVLAASKGKAVVNNRKLPAPGTAANSAPPEKKNPRDFWKDLHAKARAKFDEVERQG